MNLKIKTSVLQGMMVKAAKGASSNRMIPITSLMAIELKAGDLTLTTTDATNTLEVKAAGIEGKDFYVVIPVEVFSKLVAKTTVETISLTLKENNLEVKGNGTYKVELPLDEEGEPIHFAEQKWEGTPEVSIIHSISIKSLLGVNKAALAQTMETPCLTGYYCGDKVITTDSYKVCCNDIKLFDKSVLLPNQLVDLLDLMDDEKINVERIDDKLRFSTKGIVVYGSILEGQEDYPADAIAAYLETEFNSVCKVMKAPLLSILDRLALFVSDYDKNGVYLTFTNEGIIISSKQSTGTELLKYSGSKDFVPYACCIDIELLRSQISAQQVEEIEIWYGHEKAIKMTAGKIVQIVALLDDDRLEAGNGSEAEL